jgi:hypothetical protein
MAKYAKQSDFESNQERPMEFTTPVKGGDAPSKDDIIRSANARSKMRHDTGGDKYADEGVLPNSGGETVDKTGIKDTGYLVKKGTPSGSNVMFNTLPPGSDILDQEVADIRVEELKTWSGGLSFPGDGGF